MTPDKGDPRFSFREIAGTPWGGNPKAGTGVFPV